jgi:acarbose 7IV-phosphotransferase
MARILVSGLINLETTLKISGFPLVYNPINYPFFGVGSSLAGVGLNISLALRALGDDVRLISIIGADAVGDLVRTALDHDGLGTSFVVGGASQTAQSVILYDPDGRRQIHTDLKDIQDRALPPEVLERALAGVDLVVACNINFSRPLLGLARARGIPVVTDLHAIRDLENPYDTDFLDHADVIFFSHEQLQVQPEDVISSLFERFPARFVIVGLGDRGALFADRGKVVQHVPAVQTRPILSTVGAGDALLSGFVHGFTDGLEPREALRRAVVFASWKIGEVGAATGFVSHAELEGFYLKNTVLDTLF